MKHYTEDELAQEPLPAEVERHAATCTACGETLAFIRMFDAALQDELPRTIADELQKKVPLPPSLQAMATTLTTEHAAAMALLAPLTESLTAFQRAAVESDRAFHTPGVVRVLAELAQTQRQRQPRFALALANAAVAIGTTLQQRGELRSASFLGDAWKEKAAALVVIGKHREAEEATYRAEHFYDADPRATDHDHALAWLIRANALSETERFEEARLLCDAASSRFLEFGDTSRYNTARLLNGAILYLSGRYEEGAIVLEEIIGPARQGRDTLLLARALQTAANCHAGVSRFATALPMYFEALALWEELGVDTERVRTKWALASVLVASGKIDEGINHLEQARRDFDTLGIVNDSALVRLELAEALLAVGRPANVPSVLDGIAVSFASEGMMRSARMALAYLREAVERRELHMTDVRHVRLYLQQLPSRPALPFAPPQ